MGATSVRVVAFWLHLDRGAGRSLVFVVWLATSLVGLSLALPPICRSSTGSSVLTVREHNPKVAPDLLGGRRRPAATGNPARRLRNAGRLSNVSSPSHEDDSPLGLLAVVRTSSGKGLRATARYDRDGPWQVTVREIHEKRGS